MKTSIKSRTGLGKLIVGFVFVVFLWGVGYLSNELYKFYGHLNRFSSHIQNFNKDAAQAEIDTLEDYYNSFTNMGLRGLGDYLLEDMFLYQAELDIVSENYEKAIKDLERYSDNNMQAQYLSGIAKYRTLHAAYQMARAEGNEQGKENIIDSVMKDARPYFEQCLDDSAERGIENSNCQYNYDITSNKEETKRALENTKPGPKFILSIEGDGEDGEPSKKEPIKPDFNDDAGQGTSDKRG